MLALQASRLEIPFMSDHLRGLLLTTLGVLFVIPDALFVRLIGAEPMVTAFWRGLTAGSVVLIAVLVIWGMDGFRAVYRAGWPAMLYTVLLATTAPAFVLAVENTSVANVVFIFACMPIFAAIFSRVFLGEAIQRRMVLTMVAVLIGLGVIAYGSTSTAIASWKGDIWALYVTIAFSAALTAVRRVKEVSMVPAIPIAYIGAAIGVGLFTSPFEAFVPQWHLFLGHGAFIGAASCLLALGPRFISSTEVALLVLLESVLAPILVWMVIGEHPGQWALAGGVIVIGALLVSNLYALLSARREPS